MRLLAGIVMTTGLAAIGFGLGGSATAAYLRVTGRTGLDSAIAVALFAIGAGIVGCIAGVVLSFRLPTPRLIRWTLAASLLGAASTVYLLLFGSLQ